MNINIGIVVGRLMKDKFIEYGNKSYEQLRRKFKLQQKLPIDIKPFIFYLFSLFGGIHRPKMISE